MKIFFLSCYLTCLASISGFAQSSFRKALAQADSVVLVSHLTTYVRISSENGKAPAPRYITTGGVPNYSIIKESFRLSRPETDSLFKLLTAPNTDSEHNEIMCFLPHHAILIFKKGKCSFLDICFGCQKIINSPNVLFKYRLSQQGWKDLKAFFAQRKLNYELDFHEID
jgi:hypothetical protein